MSILQIQQNINYVTKNIENLSALPCSRVSDSTSPNQNLFLYNGCRQFGILFKIFLKLIFLFYNTPRHP